MINDKQLLCLLNTYADFKTHLFLLLNNRQVTKYKYASYERTAARRTLSYHPPTRTK